MSAAEVRVRIRPRSHRDELMGIRDGVLQARVTAPPVHGRANKALRRLIAGRLRVAPSRVQVVRGERSRDKVVRIEGLEPAAARAALERGS